MSDRIKDKPAWLTNPRKPAWVPPPYSSEDVAALKAVWAGEANAGQQRQAMEWIIVHACQYGELSYRSEKDGGTHETAFAQGRWFAGQQIQKLIGLNARLIAMLRDEENAGNTHNPRGGGNAPAGTTLVDPDKHARSGS
jgi:hypothetical protein